MTSIGHISWHQSALIKKIAVRICAMWRRARTKREWHKKRVSNCVWKECVKCFYLMNTIFLLVAAIDDICWVFFLCVVACCSLFSSCRFYLKANNEKVMNKFSQIFLGYQHMVARIQWFWAWEEEGVEKRIKVNYNLRNHNCLDSGKCYAWRGEIRPGWPQCGRDLSNFNLKLARKHWRSHNFPARLESDVANPIKRFSQCVEMGITWDSDIRKKLSSLVSTWKIPNRLIKSGKHNLLYNIEHFFVCPSSFLRLPSSFLLWRNHKSIRTLMKQHKRGSERKKC